MPRVNTFSKQAFVNNVGQTVRPGDPVVAIGNSTGRITTRSGTFDGVYLDKRLNVVGVRVSGIPKTRFKLVYEEYAKGKRSPKYVTEKFIGATNYPNKRVYALA